jgi:hypothetical protein
MAKRFDPESFPPHVTTREAKLEYVILRLLAAIDTAQRAAEFAAKVLERE